MPRQLHKTLISCLLIITFFISLPASENNMMGLKFEWSLQVKDKDPEKNLYGNGYTVLIEDKPVSLKPGSLHKFYFNSPAPLYYYLFIISREAGNMLLFPGISNGYNHKLPAADAFFVPGKIWLPAQKAGSREVFLLVVSRDPLEKTVGIQVNFRRFFKIVHNTDKTEKELELCEEVREELIRLYKTFLVPVKVKEDFLTVSGVFKSGENPVQQVSCPSPYYIKRFELDY